MRNRDQVKVEELQHYFYNPDTDEEYTLNITKTTITTPGVWTLSNGDPGYPDESEVIFDYDDTDKPDWVTQEMIDKIIN